MSLVFAPVPQYAVDIVWDAVCPLLNAAADVTPDKTDIDSIRDGIAVGLYLLWVVADDGKVIAAMTTRIIDYPKRRALAVDWMGGSRMKEWLPMVNESLAKHAKLNECMHIEGYGRPAWLRWLSKHGWRQESVTFRVDLED